jgi:sphingomyelin phosphodiesterase 2
LGSSGLVLLSKFPIKEVQFHKYRKNGHAFRVDHGDYHVGKGIAFAKIAIADNQNINVLFTHTIAGYSKEDAYLPDRVSQVWEIVRFLRNYSKDEPIFLCGDLNCNPDSIEYNVLKYHGKLIDSYKEHNQKGVDGSKDLGLTLLTGPERLDYVFFRKSENIQLLHSKVVLNDPTFLYSDHFGVTSTFSITCGNHAQKQNKGKNSLTNEMKKGVSEEEEEEEVEDDSNQHLERSIIEQSTGIVHHGKLQAEKRKINHFVRAASLLFVIYLLASLNSPHLFVIAATLFFALDIITGLFFVGCEVTALNQIHEELRYLSK